MAGNSGCDGRKTYSKKQSAAKILKTYSSMDKVQRLSREGVGFIARNGEIDMSKITDITEFISLMDKGYTNEQLSSHFNCGSTTIKRFKQQNNLVGYKTNSRPLSSKQIEEIIALTEKGYSLQKISEKTGKSHYVLKKYVPDFIYQNILVNSRNTFSSNLVKADIKPIFTASNYSAYICGVLQSDGFLTSDGYIGLTAKDKDFVETFAKFFNTNIREVQKDNTMYYSCRFKDVRNLEKFKQITNIYPQKTYSSYKIPDWIKTNSIFLQYFIAGVFDGDGWVYRVKDRQYTLEIGIEQHCMSKSFLLEINDFLDWGTYASDSTFRLQTKSKEKVKKFYDWYSQIEFIMLRKISVFDSVYL